MPVSSALRGLVVFVARAGAARAVVAVAHCVLGLQPLERAGRPRASTLEVLLLFRAPRVLSGRILAVLHAHHSFLPVGCFCARTLWGPRGTNLPKLPSRLQRDV